MNLIIILNMEGGYWFSERENRIFSWSKGWGEFCIWMISKDHDWLRIYNANSCSDKATWECKIACLDW